MTHEKKIEDMKIAAGICGFGFSYDQMDLLVSLYDLVCEKGSETDLHSISDTEFKAKERADQRSREALLDKVSKKA